MIKENATELYDNESKIWHIKSDNKIRNQKLI